MDPEMSENNNWHLDKRVPIALIFTIVAQTFVAGFWLSQLQQRVFFLEEKVDAMAGQDRRLTRLETRMESIIDALGRIEKKLE